MDIIDGLKKYFLADEWMIFDNFKDVDLKKFFLRLHLEAREDPTSYNKEVTREHEYGANIPRISKADIDVLKFCKEAQQNKITATFLDLGSGWGSMSWKALVSGCKVYSVDISFIYEDFLEGFTNSIDRVVPEKLHENIVPISRSLYDLLPLHPEYANLFDVVYSARVLNFQAPKKFNDFAKAIYDLLKPTGTAYVIENSINLIESQIESLGTRVVKNCRESYQENKNNKFISPGYMYSEIFQNKDRKVTKLICSNEYQEEMKGWDIMPESEYTALDNGMKTSSFIALFDTETLEGIFTQVGFKVSDAYYLDNTAGAKYLSQNENGTLGVFIKLEKEAVQLCDQASLVCGEEGIA